MSSPDGTYPTRKAEGEKLWPWEKDPQYLAPYFPHILRTPFSDATSATRFHQNSDPRCARFETNYWKCVSAYGHPRAEKECGDFLDDYRECQLGHKQAKRVFIMNKERKRQIKSGEIPKDEKYIEAPPQDSYIHSFTVPPKK